MENVITLDANNQGSFFGAIASRYAYTPELRNRLNELFAAAKRSRNRYFVLEGTSLRAAQNTRHSAEKYMQAGRVLVAVELQAAYPMMTVIVPTILEQKLFGIPIKYIPEV